MNLARIRWFDAEPEVLRREQEAMREHAPNMQWVQEIVAREHVCAGWEGEAPQWPAHRPAPEGLDELLEGKRLKLAVAYPEGFPMVEPVLLPRDPVPLIERRTQHRWHVNGDGSLCLVQSAEDWQPARDTAADLVLKASAWFIEYRLVETEKCDQMAEHGIVNDDSLDALIREFAP